MVVKPATLDEIVGPTGGTSSTFQNSHGIGAAPIDDAWRSMAAARTAAPTP